MWSFLRALKHFDDDPHSFCDNTLMHRLVSAVLCPDPCHSHFWNLNNAEDLVSHILDDFSVAKSNGIYSLQRDRQVLTAKLAILWRLRNTLDHDQLLFVKDFFAHLCLSDDSGCLISRYLEPFLQDMHPVLDISGFTKYFSPKDFQTIIRLATVSINIFSTTSLVRFISFVLADAISYENPNVDIIRELLPDIAEPFARQLLFIISILSHKMTLKVSPLQLFGTSLLALSNMIEESVNHPEVATTLFCILYLLCNSFDMVQRSINVLLRIPYTLSHVIYKILCTGLPPNRDTWSYLVSSWTGILLMADKKDTMSARKIIGLLFTPHSSDFYQPLRRSISSKLLDNIFDLSFAYSFSIESESIMRLLLNLIGSSENQVDVYSWTNRLLLIEWPTPSSLYCSGALNLLTKLASLPMFDSESFPKLEGSLYALAITDLTSVKNSSWEYVFAYIRLLRGHNIDQLGDDKKSLEDHIINLVSKGYTLISTSDEIDCGTLPYTALLSFILDILPLSMWSCSLCSLFIDDLSVTQGYSSEYSALTLTGLLRSYVFTSLNDGKDALADILQSIKSIVSRCSYELLDSHIARHYIVAECLSAKKTLKASDTQCSDFAKVENVLKEIITPECESNFLIGSYGILSDKVSIICPSCHESIEELIDDIIISHNDCEADCVGD